MKSWKLLFRRHNLGTVTWVMRCDMMECDMSEKWTFPKSILNIPSRFMSPKNIFYDSPRFDYHNSVHVMPRFVLGTFSEFLIKISVRLSASRVSFGSKDIRSCNRIEQKDNSSGSIIIWSLDHSQRLIKKLHSENVKFTNTEQKLSRLHRDLKTLWSIRNAFLTS